MTSVFPILPPFYAGNRTLPAEPEDAVVPSAEFNARSDPQLLADMEIPNAHGYP